METILSTLKQKFIFLRRMRIRFLLAILCAGMIPALLIAWILIEENLVKSVDNSVSDAQGYMTKLANQLTLSGLSMNNGTTNLLSEMKLAATFYNGRIFVVDHGLKILADTYERETGKTLLSENVIRSLRGTNKISRDVKSKSAEITISLMQEDTKDVIGAIVMRFSLEHEYALAENLRQKMGIASIFIFVILAIVSVTYSANLVKPLKAVVVTINHVTDGYMEEEVSIKGYYEIEQISDAFNAMLKRMKALEDSRQEFVSNVSHELKTPITSIKVLAESLLMQEDAPVTLYREFMSDIKDEIERESKIISDLLSLAKLDKTTGDMHIAEVNINELLEIILKRLKPIAMKRNIELVFESFRPVAAEIDEVKLSLAISNLIENAVKYNIEDGWIRVSLNADHKYFYIKVSDSGIGIAEEEIAHIFDRFYRVDKARSRESGGTGLGLAITKNVILMHNGAIKVYSKENEGTTFTMRVPLSYIA